MSFYSKEVTRLRDQLYSKEYLLNRVIIGKHFIEKNSADKINIDKIAAMAMLSKFHFIRTFRYYYGCTPNQHLITVRMQKAKLLLQDGKSISESCFLSGYESISSFTGLFKKSNGMTPSLFARQYAFTKSNFRETCSKNSLNLCN